MKLLTLSSGLVKALKYLSIFLFLYLIKKVFDSLLQIEHIYLPLIINTIITIIVLSVFSKAITSRKITNKVFIISILIFTFIARVYWIVSINTVPFSDFSYYLHIGEKIFNGDGNVMYRSTYYQAFPFNAPFTIYEGFVYKIFNSIFVLKFLNVLYSTTFVLLLYLIMNKIKNNKVARIVAFFTAIFPPFIIYTSILTNQTLSIFFLLLALYSLLNNNKYIITGVFLAIAHLIRPTIIIYLIGIIIFIILSNFQKKETFKVIFKELLLQLSLVITSFYFIIYIVSTSLVVTKLTKNSLFYNPIPSYKLLVGLNHTTKGLYSKNDNKLIFEDISSFEEKARKLISERISDKKKLFKLIDTKSAIFWGNLDSSLDWAFSKNLNTKKYYKYLIIDGHYMYLVLMLLSVFTLFQKNQKYDIIVLMNVLMIGFWIVYTLIEIQTRYRYEIYPILLISASIGMNKFLELKIFKPN